jgi:predicted membrane protein (TIGR00267 family)
MAPHSRRGRAFAIVIGVTDGILTALTLAAARVVSSADPLTVNLALRIAAASALSGMFVFFAAEYIHQREGLVHAERQLSLRSGGHLAATHLGRAVLRETLWAAVLSSVCNFAGALVPLLAGALAPERSWLAVAVGILVLGGLGVAGARATHGRLIVWVGALMAAGVVLAAIGLKLRIV